MRGFNRKALCFLRLVISGFCMRSGQIQAEACERNCEARFIEREGLACISEKASKSALSAPAVGLTSAEECRESQGGGLLGAVALTSIKTEAGS